MESKAPAPLPGLFASRKRSQTAACSRSDALASLLVTGTAIGGGFLALPYTTAPAGFGPSVVLMLLSWLLLLLEASIATELLAQESTKGSEPRRPNKG